MRPKVNSLDSIIHLEGNEAVVRRLFEKRQLMDEGKPHQHIRPLLLIMAGSMRGVYGGGNLLALRQAGLGEVFDNIVGISTGAPSGAYFLADQVEKGASIYFEECVKRPLFSVRRSLSTHTPLADIDYLAKVYRGQVGRKKLDERAIKKSRTGLYFAVSKFETGKQDFLDAKSVRPDVAQAIVIATDLPMMYLDYIEYDGQKYLDGGVADFFPIKKILSKFKPTDVLIFPNISERDVMHGKDAAERVYDTVALMSLPKRFVSKMLTNHTRFIESLSWLRVSVPTRTRWLIVWPDDKVDKLTLNTKKLSAAYKRSAKFFAKYLKDIQITMAAVAAKAEFGKRRVRRSPRGVRQ